jgi:hypothetical protein
MKFNWKFFVNLAIPFIEAAGRDYCAKDENNVGKDDIIGQSLIYVAVLLSAIVNDAPIPKAPEVLK